MTIADFSIFIMGRCNIFRHHNFSQWSCVWISRTSFGKHRCLASLPALPIQDSKSVSSTTRDVSKSDVIFLQSYLKKIWQIYKVIVFRLPNDTHMETITSCTYNTQPLSRSENISTLKIRFVVILTPIMTMSSKIENSIFRKI